MEDISQEADTTLLSNISAPEKEGSTDSGNEINDGFDLADELLPPDLCLEQIKDFQEKVEKEAKRRQDLSKNNDTDETNYVDHDSDSYLGNSDNNSNLNTSFLSLEQP